MNTRNYTYRGSSLREGDWSTKYHYSNKEYTFGKLCELSTMSSDSEEIKELCKDLLYIERGSKNEYMKNFKDTSEKENTSLERGVRYYLNTFISEIRENGSGSTSSIRMYRSLTLDDISSLDRNDLGICWTYDKNNLKEIETTIISNKKDYMVRLFGTTSASNIDWLESLYLFIKYGGNEKELRVIDPKQIKLRGYMIYYYSGWLGEDDIVIVEEGGTTVSLKNGFESIKYKKKTF